MLNNTKDEKLFIGHAQINPAAFQTGEESLIITRESISFGSPIREIIKFSDIKEISKKKWLGLSSTINIKYLKNDLIKEVRFIITNKGLENPYLKRKLLKIIIKIWKNKPLDYKLLDKINKIVNDKSGPDFSSKNGWIIFIVATIIVVLLQYLAIKR